MTELEKLRKHMKWFRSFGKAIRKVLLDSEAGTTKDKARNATGIVRTYENQWPNWLDDDIEKMEDT